ncbi:hypothetical protein BD408DRAFT_445975 [Parasitella parasitica]|nr:hypothetical protein BD408DRAFT_445975 [Parasitella parasitica]
MTTTTEQAPKIDFNFYEQPSTISYFDAIVEDLRDDLGSIGVDTTFTAPELAYFTARFLQFQQNALRLNRNQSKPLPARIPTHFFNVEMLSKPSPLYTILQAAYTFQSDNDISDWQFDAPEERDIYLELVRVITEQLIQDGFYMPPVVAFDETVTNKTDIDEWSRIVMALGGQIVDVIPSATHIIYNSVEPVFNSESCPFYIEEQKNGKALIHYIGLPDSYNTWVTEIGDGQVPKPSLSSPWHIRATWILDSYKYNEWMSPIDYDYPEKHLNRMSLKRSADESAVLDTNSPLKKVKTPIGEQPTVQLGNEISTLITEDNAPSQTPSSPVPTAKTENTDSVIQAPLLPVDLSAIPLPEEDPQRYLTIQSHEIVIPSYAAWFDITTVNVIESRALPEFFNDRNKSKTPTVYKTYRDFMVNTYRMNPVEYLTITACRRNLIGDVCAILRVHSFLEQWGLINYQVDPEVKLSSLSPPFDSQFKVVIDKVIENQLTEEANEKQDFRVKDEPAVSRYSFGKEKKPQKCSSCETECTSEQFCSTTQTNFYLCRPCFVAGKYPMDQDNGNFVLERVGNKNDDTEDGDAWDEKEESLLKQGLKLYQDDWEKISNHVGTRTQEECILHYLQLPTNDPFSDVEIQKLGLLQYDFAQYQENPIMAAVAFLASAVQPEVAAAAGHIDIEKFKDEIMIEVEAEDETLVKEEEKKAEGAKEDCEVESEKKDTSDVEKVDEAKQDEEQGADTKAITEEQESPKTEKEENELCNLTNTLIRFKLAQYKQQASHYVSLEDVVEEQKRKLEKEKHQLEHDQSLLKKKLLSIHLEMTKRGSSATAIANSITPAQLQQQLAGTSPSMFLNGQQPHLQPQPQQQLNPQQSPQVLQQMQLQQQQYQLRMQMQLQQQQLQFQQQQQQQQQQQHHQQQQQQQQHHQQQQHQQHHQQQQQEQHQPGPPGFNNMMSL